MTTKNTKDTRTRFSKKAGYASTTKKGRRADRAICFFVFHFVSFVSLVVSFLSAVLEEFPQERCGVVCKYSTLSDQAMVEWR